MSLRILTRAQVRMAVRPLIRVIWRFRKRVVELNGSFETRDLLHLDPRA